MAGSRAEHEIYLEVGAKRVFAGATGWPGWCRGGRDVDSALGALVTYAPRYAEIVGPVFRSPTAVTALRLAERLTGDATTDFGAPSKAPADDARPLNAKDLDRMCGVLQACWAAFDRSVIAARGLELTKGPRGGGRSLDAIVGHVAGAEASYARRIGAKGLSFDDDDAAGALDDIRSAVMDALSRALSDGLPETGPRGGKMWTARYFVRRAAWHVTDHLWEIQDRSAPSTG